MKIFVNLSPFADDLRSQPLQSRADLCERALGKGFDGIEVNLKVTENLETEWVLSSLDGCPITFHSSFSEFNPGSPNPFIRRAAVDQLEHELSLAESLKGRAFTFHPGWAKKIKRDAALDHLWRSLDTFFTNHTIDSACRLCMENMDDTPDKLCSTVDEIRRTLKRFPALLLTCDVAHLGKQGIDASAFVDEFHDRIGHVHASGYKPDRRHSTVSLAESDIDYSSTFSRLRDRDIIVAIENRNWSLACETRDFIRNAIGTYSHDFAHGRRHRPPKTRRRIGR